jgi:bacterioferritin
VIARILYLDGVPNMQRMNPVRVGEDPIEQHRVDLALETEAIKRLNDAIELARSKGDNGTREVLEKILEGEEHSADWLEAQLHIVEEIGKERYLAEQIHA